MGSAADDSDLEFLEQAQAMRELLPYLRTLVGDSATVTARNHWVTEPDGSVDRGRSPSTRSVLVRPHNPAALAVDLTCEQWIVVEVGRVGGRWELGYEDADVAQAKRLLDAAVAGRVAETFALGRSRVVVTLTDGSTETETGYQGCLTSLVPLPGWKKWGRTTQYEPYRSIVAD
ncbi:hypothetical protein [Curtobacterium sp. MCBA15_001]|uniref:hypothetical protein n=1 Tax=Curtobacterium sp. MCBA15_001 TaxID=1898731 RepID=UPI0008DD8184|nr:hypothetical protein [Curtobacterium sp. MCBA15_001]OIH92424.1 hypothetical protein BIU90_11065 [Curtobacterium sp. MCBA15_001]